MAGDVQSVEPSTAPRVRARITEEAPVGGEASDRSVPAPEVRPSLSRVAHDAPVRVLLRAAGPDGLLRVREAASRTDSVEVGSILAGPNSAEASLALFARRPRLEAVLGQLEATGVDPSGAAVALRAAVNGYFRARPRTVRGVHRALVLGERTLVMGVVNVTPDSFSDGGKFVDPDAALAHAKRMIEEGADVIDVGGESTRPGAVPVGPESEWRRVGPVLDRVRSLGDVVVSVDTRHPEVAEKALAAGADLVNDVGGLRDPAMRRLLARTGAPAIAMHMRGTPATMQEDLEYGDVVTEVGDWLEDATGRAVSEGVSADRLIVDPGLGFGKSPAQNLEILDRLGEFRSLGYPIAIGASRKSFLGWVLGDAPVGERVDAGVAAAVVAARAGADIVRTHDVGPTVRALALADALGRRPRGPAPSNPARERSS